MPEKIELTDEELQAKIDEAVKKAVTETTDTLTKKHNEEMANQRITAKKDKEDAIKKAKEEAQLSDEEIAAKKIEEERKAEKEELEQLRLEKKINDRAKKLQENGLPDFFKNDSRLLNAEEEKVDEVIATIKKEWESNLPKGAQVNTNVRGGNQGGKTEEELELERVRNLGVGSGRRKK